MANNNSRKMIFMLEEKKPPNSTTYALEEATPARSKTSHFQTPKSQVKLLSFRQCSKPHRVNVPSLQSFMWMGRASPTSTLILALVGQDFCQSAVTQKKHEKYDLNLEIDLFSEEGCLSSQLAILLALPSRSPRFDGWCDFLVRNYCQETSLVL